MKKIKFLVVPLILFFCLMMKKNIKADAANNVIKIYDGDTISSNSAIVLNSGCYFFGCRGTQISLSNLKGDFDYYFQEPGIPHLELHMISDELEMTDTELFFGAEEEFLKKYSSEQIEQYGVHVVNVKSYAVFFTKTSISNVLCYGGYRQTPNTDCNIAGNMTHFVDCDHPTPLSEIKARYQAIDNVDGDISKNLVFETNYDPNHLSIGTYYILMHVKDNANHITYAADIIRVKDFTPPSIELSKTEHVVEVHTSFTFEDAKKFFTAQDNYTPQASIQWEFKDDYKNQYNTVGTYHITATAKDQESNSATATLTIRVVDTTKPVISLIAGGNTIYATHILSDNEIRALLQVTDNYSALSNSQIRVVQNTCTGQQGKEYTLKVEVTDESNNIGEQSFKYFLMDTEAPIIMVEKTLYIPIGSTYTNEQIINMLKEAGIISAQAVNISLSTQNISTDKEGQYEITYTETLPDGSIKEGKVNLTVFSKVEDAKNTEASNTFSWYFLLLLLPVVAIVVIVIIKKHCHEKN
ncbi:MAG: DUF5011 domain-containing protein [Roseburia sp.]|nr:DUF5011 domain-containing protein [Anaeroplasma bactoclasticum]MCM1196645.1 DUF5011 domain-containing protein [Roseburia sp.]MCM1557529.1 DUF5011 domain-containing protein [Anaeroplasma bactoclasticum]